MLVLGVPQTLGAAYGRIDVYPGGGKELAHHHQVHLIVILIFEQTQRRSLMITTDSVCDLPESLIREFGIVVSRSRFWARGFPPCRRHGARSDPCCWKDGRNPEP